MFWLAFGRKIKLLLFSHENNTTGAPASAPSGTQGRREGAPSDAWRCVGVPYRWTVEEQLKVFFPPLKDGLMFCKDGQVILIHQWCLDGKNQRRWISCSSASCPFQKKVYFPSPANIFFGEGCNIKVVKLPTHKVVVTDVCPTFSRGLSIQSGLQYSQVGQPSHACSCQTATSTQLCG